MLIRSQDKTALVKFENIVINLKLPDSLNVICWSLQDAQRNGGYLILGKYSTKEKAMKVLDIFAKFKGTDNWKRGMFEKTSKYVIATVVFDDGTVLVEQAYTTDGIWKTDKKVLGGTVVAWMDYPEPYKED